MTDNTHEAAHTHEPVPLAWKFDSEAWVIREDTEKGLALFEVLTATEAREAELAASAPTLAEEHRLLVDALRNILHGSHPCVNTETQDHTEVCKEHTWVLPCPWEQARAILDQIERRRDSRKEVHGG